LKFVFKNLLWFACSKLKSCVGKAKNTGGVYPDETVVCDVLHARCSRWIGVKLKCETYGAEVTKWRLVNRGPLALGACFAHSIIRVSYVISNARHSS
jgi:hypothetical protein